MPRPRPSLLACVAAVLVLGACGGGSEADSAAGAPSGAPSPVPSPFAQAEYVARAEALCESANFDLERVTAGEPADVGEGLNTLDLVVTRIDAVTGDLNALTAPQPDAAELDRIFIEPLFAQAEVARSYRDAFRAASEQGPQAVAAVPEPPAATPAPDLAAMRSYGFTECAELAESS